MGKKRGIREGQVRVSGTLMVRASIFFQPLGGAAEDGTGRWSSIAM